MIRSRWPISWPDPFNARASIQKAENRCVQAATIWAKYSNNYGANSRAWCVVNKPNRGLRWISLINSYFYFRKRSRSIRLCPSCIIAQVEGASWRNRYNCSSRWAYSDKLEWGQRALIYQSKEIEFTLPLKDTLSFSIKRYIELIMK